MICIVPFAPIPNHEFSAVLPIDSQNLTLKFNLTYNELANYWVVSISKNNEMVASGLPVIPAENILEQLQYLHIGSAYIVPRSEASTEWPGANDLDTNWWVLWSDTQ